MDQQFVLALDQGTSSTRALLFDGSTAVCAIAQRELSQYYPRPGWVEHDPLEIWRDQMDLIREVMQQASIGPQQISAIGITNQRETTVLWDAKSGRPIHRAIVWQDRRTAPICEQLRQDGFADHVRQTTGLVIDAYFSGTKIKWLLDEVPGAREKAERGELRFGTIDSWLIWNMTGGEQHLTDYTNASRTLLFDINRLSWDQTLLRALHIPDALLPQVRPSASEFGIFRLDGHAIPILGVAGDQQAALFGQCCTGPGMAKNTYGTGCFLLMHTGDQLTRSQHGLLTTIACTSDGAVGYALEGSIFIAGAAIQWLRDSLRILDDAADSAYLARQASEQDDLYVVPAFSGLGAPHWDMYARGAILGLTRDTDRKHIIRGTLQSLAYQTRDVLEAMLKDTGLDLSVLRVDGGASANDYLMQFQADILHVPVERPQNIESTAAGAAFLAGLQVGLWSFRELCAARNIDRTFLPEMPEDQRKKRYSGWLRAVDRTKSWIDS